MLKISQNEPMSKHSTFKVGGNAQIFASPESIDDLLFLLNICHNNNIGYFILGNGSNILVADEGIQGLVVSLKKMQCLKLMEDNYIFSEAGVNLAKLAMFAYERGLTGLEFAHGIPGTVGGGVIMNAGAYGGEMSQVCSAIEVIKDGKCIPSHSEQATFSYRSSYAKENNLIVASAIFKLKEGCKADIKAKMYDFMQKRQDKQPLDLPSAGSTFKRPEGHFAGKLIMDAGLAGYSIGGAKVSEKHCGFIVNYNNATARDILNLIEYVQTVVYERFGVMLEREVQLVGF